MTKKAITPVFQIKDPTSNYMNPIDFFNQFGNWAVIFDGAKHQMIATSDTTAGYYDDKPVFELIGRDVHVLEENKFDLVVGTMLTPFMLLTIIRFKRNYHPAMVFVETELQKKPIDYVRVGPNYFGIIKDKNRWGTPIVELEPWKKEEIKQDFSYDKTVMDRIPKFKKFIVEPDNKNHAPHIGTKYNDYRPFPHKPLVSDRPVKASDIPNTMSVMANIFGDKCRGSVPLGFIYMKTLYDHPKQILPVLTLTSRKRETGKSTFLNWISMLFADNTVMVTSKVLNSDFTSSYANKNIIMIDEAVHEKSEAMENIKFISTTKMLPVNQKNISVYSVPFYGKIIMCTNREIDFMRIDEEEIRFWVRKIQPISGEKNTKIEAELFREIPAFLKYLDQLPPVDLSKSRQVLTEDEIYTEALGDVMRESWSSLRKLMQAKIDMWFVNNPSKEYMQVTAEEIKDEWFKTNNKYESDYISKVLRVEMNIQSESRKHTSPFIDNPYVEVKKQMRCFRIKNQNFTGTEDIPSEDMPSTASDPF